MGSVTQNCCCTCTDFPQLQEGNNVSIKTNFPICDGLFPSADFEGEVISVNNNTVVIQPFEQHPVTICCAYIESVEMEANEIP